MRLIALVCFALAGITICAQNNQPSVKLDLNYDKYSDVTSYQLSPIYEERKSPETVFKVQASLKVKGKAGIATPTDFRFTIASYEVVDGQQTPLVDSYSKASHLFIISDTGRSDLARESYLGTPKNTGRNERHETMTFVLTMEDALMILHSKRLECKLGDKTFKISDDHLIPLVRLLAQLFPRG